MTSAGWIVGWRRGWSFGGSGEPKLLFLVPPDCRQVASEPGDGEIGRGSTLGGRLDDARGEIGERRQEPNVPLGQVLPFCDRTDVRCRVFDDCVDPPRYGVELTDRATIAAAVFGVQQRYGISDRRLIDEAKVCRPEAGRSAAAF